MNRDTAAATDSLLIRMRGRAATVAPYWPNPGIPDGPPIRVSRIIAVQLIWQNMADPMDSDAVDEMKRRGFSFPLSNDNLF